jgi:polyphosphate kinase
MTPERARIAHPEAAAASPADAPEASGTALAPVGGDAVRPEPVESAESMSEIENTGPNEADLFLNRELGLLEFQQRVLDEARKADNPLLERVKFLAILGSNLDEFFMVRVGGLIMQQKAGVVELSIDGQTAAEQLAAIRKRVQKLSEEAHLCLREELRPALAEAGIHILEYADLADKQKAQAEAYFRQVAFPVLTPQAHDPGRPFPHISNRSLNLAVEVRSADGEKHFARVKVPATLPRLVPIKRSSGSVKKDGTVPRNHYFVWLEQVIAAHVDELFHGMEVLAVHPFRVTRNADLEIQELEASDLLEFMAASVLERQFGTAVRLCVAPDMPKRIRKTLMANLEVGPNDVYTTDGPLGLGGLWQLDGIERHDLKFPSHTPATTPALRMEGRESSFFPAIRQGDILVHHPYDAFTPVIEFLHEAMRDPRVLAIKATLYRTGADSPIVKALLEARREYRKQVAVLVELKARFDEESNIGWARRLEREGVHVTYGLVGLKTHCKLLLVVRQEGDAIRRYVHLGTGNYNAGTARIYEDVGLFTCDEEIGADATDVFNYLTGYSAKTDYRKLLLAPVTMRERVEALIRREIEHQTAGRPGHMILKMNALVDKSIIPLLYEASQAGVRVDLIIRGICCLRPGIPGLSENIRVVSVVGRFLEHSRIYWFANGGDGEVYAGSADLMTRNLNRRVEVLFPVQDPAHRRYLRDEVLATYLQDNVKARIMLPDGDYEELRPADGEEPVSVQDRLMTRQPLGDER